MTVDGNRVLKIIERELDLDPGDITHESSAGEVDGWDSLGHLRVCMALESAFGVSFDMERVGELTTPSALIEYIDGLLAA